MERQVIRDIEAKAAQIRKRFRINPDRIVRWGLLVGALVGAPVALVEGVTAGLPWTQVAPITLGGALIGLLLFGLVAVGVSVVYEMLMGVVDFVGRFRKAKPGAPDSEDF